MIKIHPPKVKRTDDNAIISAFIEKADGENDYLWFSVPLKYEKYLITEQLDAFVVAMLFLGLKTGEDIKLLGPVSSKLLYAMRHYIIDAFCLVNPKYKKIQILPIELSCKNFNVAEVSGTGLSCGIDSFTTYFSHINEQKPYNIEYFTFFNVGSHGDNGGDRARKVFHERKVNVQNFANEVDKDLIVVDSNLSEILEMKFQETYNLRTVSCVLLFQKLLKNYYYASGTRFDHFGFNKNEIADLDMLIIPNLSTESTSIYVSALKFSRIERTDFISRFPETYNFLDVCTNPTYSDAKFINCSHCYKCKRTMFTLDILGKLKLYSGVFDTSSFPKQRSKYIGFLLSKEKKLTLDKELINYIKTRETMSLKVYYYSCKNVVYRKMNQFKKKLR